MRTSLSTVDIPALGQAEVPPMAGLGARRMLIMGLEAFGIGNDALADRLLPILVDHCDALVPTLRTLR